MLVPFNLQWSLLKLGVLPSTELHGTGLFIATRIIDLARNGVTDAKALSERVIAEVKAMRSL